MTRPRALIIGGSVGGLFAANLLRSSGWDAVVFERNPEELTGRGAGIRTHPQLHDVMRRLGIPFDDSMGIRVNRVIFFDREGQAYDQRDTARVMSSWGRVFRSLRDLIPAEAIASTSRSLASSRTVQVSPRFSPTAAASAVSFWSAPTAAARLCASNSCPTGSQSTPAMSPGVRCWMSEKSLP